MLTKNPTQFKFQIHLDILSVLVHLFGLIHINSHYYSGKGVYRLGCEKWLQWEVTEKGSSVTATLTGASRQ